MPVKPALAFALALAFAGCGRGDSSGDGCGRDSDCPGGGRCIASACVSLTNPLDASIPDLSGSDFSPGD